jgi:hypothetical protein
MLCTSWSNSQQIMDENDSDKKSALFKIRHPDVITLFAPTKHQESMQNIKVHS